MTSGMCTHTHTHAICRVTSSGLTIRDSWWSGSISISSKGKKVFRHKCSQTCCLGYTLAMEFLRNEKSITWGKRLSKDISCFQESYLECYHAILITQGINSGWKFLFYFLFSPSYTLTHTMCHRPQCRDDICLFFWFSLPFLSQRPPNFRIECIQIYKQK